MITSLTRPYSFYINSVAGTAGAVVTCPLEVVKTRLQSSNAFLPHPTNRPSRYKELSGIQSSSSSLNNALRRPEQHRKFSSTILRRIRPQVITTVQHSHLMNERHVPFLFSLSSFSFSEIIDKNVLSENHW